MNVIEYQGFYAKIEYHAEDQVMIGRVLDTEDTVVFEIQSTSEVESIFHKCLDDYLETCKSIGKDPHKTYNGSFNLRLPDALYKALLRHASLSGLSINHIVNLAVKAYLEKSIL